MGEMLDFVHCRDVFHHHVDLRGSGDIGLEAGGAPARLPDRIDDRVGVGG